MTIHLRQCRGQPVIRNRNWSRHGSRHFRLESNELHRFTFDHSLVCQQFQSRADDLTERFRRWASVNIFLGFVFFSWILGPILYYTDVSFLI